MRKQYIKIYNHLHKIHTGYSPSDMNQIQSMQSLQKSKEKRVHCRWTRYHSRLFLYMDTVTHSPNSDGRPTSSDPGVRKMNLRKNNCWSLRLRALKEPLRTLVKQVWSEMYDPQLSAVGWSKYGGALTESHLITLGSLQSITNLIAFPTSRPFRFTKSSSHPVAGWRGNRRHPIRRSPVWFHRDTQGLL